MQIKNYAQIVENVSNFDLWVIVYIVQFYRCFDKTSVEFYHILNYS